MPDQTILQQLQQILDKIDTPDRVALFSQFGVQYYADAAYLNLLRDALIELYSISGQGEGQNNLGKYINVGYLQGPSIYYDIITALNNITFVVSPLETPVVIEAMKVIDGQAKKFRFFFVGGKGTWGSGGSPVWGVHLIQFAQEDLTVNDITGQDNAEFINLGPINQENFVIAANDVERDVSDPNKFYYFIYDAGNETYIRRFTGEAGIYGGESQNQFDESDFTTITDSTVQPGNVTPNLNQVLTSGGVSDRKIKLTDIIGSLIEYSGKLISYRKGAYSSQIGFEDPVATIQLLVPAKTSNDTFAMVSDINGLTIEANQAAAELYLKDSSGNILATINVGFLNNEGTTFHYNSSSGMLELKDDEGNILSSVPVSAFVSNLIQSVEFNGSTPYVLEFKDAENNVVDSVSFAVSNIQGLQALLDSKFNNPDGTTAQYIRGNGSLSLFASDVRASTLTGLSTSSQAVITGSDDVLSALGKLQGQLNNTLLIKLVIPASTDLNIYTETGIYNQTLNTQAASGSNYPTPLAGTLEVVRISSTLICQRYHVVGGGVSADNVIYTRIYASGAWGAWKRLITSLDTNVANWDAVYADRVNYLRNQADGNVGAYLGNSASSIADVNNLITGMAWLIGSTLNLPNASSHHVVSFGGSSSYQSQLALRGGNFYFRSKEASVWQAWKRLWHDGDFTSTNVANWNTAFGWGDFRQFGLGATGTTNISDANNQNLAGGLYTTSTSTSNTPIPGSSGSLLNIRSGVAGGAVGQIWIRSNNATGDDVYIRHCDNAGTFTSWKRLWHDGDFTSTNISNWNTAFGWGNHSGKYAKTFGTGGYNDFNTMYSAGTCFLLSDASPLNAPEAFSARWAVNQYIAGAGGYGYQIAIAANNGTDSRKIWYRHGGDTGFSTWKRLWHSEDFTSTNVANWNTAYGWGDFRTYGHGTGVTNNPLVSADVLEFNTTGVFRVASSAPSLPVAENGYLYRIYRSASTRYILFYSDSGRVYKNVMNSSTWSGWKYFWDSGDFTSANIASWNGYASNKADLVDGKVPASQLPSYVDDVLEYANLAAFPASGESGKLYVAIDTNLVYRWSGSAYVVTSSSLALGETSVTAYRGDRGKTAYDHSQTTGNPHNTTINDITGLQAAIDSAVDTVKRPYRSYTALITQTGTNVPSVIILENNLGFTPTWTYVSTGVYRLNSVGNFPDERCIIFSNIGLPYSASNSYEIRWSRTTSPDYLQINTVEKSGSANAVNANNVLNNASIEVRIYDV